MESNKLKKSTLPNSGNLNGKMNLPQIVSNSNLNQQFWQSLKDTINTKKDSQSIKGRIFTAKRILTPIIQELMKDALEQMEAEEVENSKDALKQMEAEEVENSVGGKEVEVLYSNIRANDIWHIQTGVRTDGEEWAMRILREISRDFEQPFDKIHERENEIQESSPKDILLNKTLLKKLVTIHQHLENIIKRLTERCKPKRIVEKDNNSLNDFRNCEMNVGKSSSLDIKCSALTNQKEAITKSYNVNTSGIRYPKDDFLTRRTSVYERSLAVKNKRDTLTVENACSPFNFGEIQKTGLSISNKILYDVGVSYHALFEENRNNIGNKEIVIKCLEDLEKVRKYLEAMRDNKECEKPKFTDLESCKNYECLESQPHLHSNLHNMPMVLKLNKHADENERNSDLIIGIPSLMKSSPDVHILLNTKNQHVDIKKAPGPLDRNENHRKNSYRVSRIPKPVDKKRLDLGRFVKSNSMKIKLESKDSLRRNVANLLIFDPDDPSKSIIKMKEQKTEEKNDSRSVVSSICCTMRYQEIFIVKCMFCCIGGKYTIFRVHNRFLVKCYLSINVFLVKYSCFFIMKKLMLKLTHSFSFLVDKNPMGYLQERDINCSQLKAQISWKEEPKSLECLHEQSIENYVRYLLNFITFKKGSLKHKTLNENDWCNKNFHFHNNFNLNRRRGGTLYATYFFECLKENKEKQSCEMSPQKKWDEQSQDQLAYPVWTIKRSKYYSVPQSKNKNEVVLEQKLEDNAEAENTEQLNLEDVDSLDNIGEPHNEITMQISQVSVHSTRLAEEELEDDNDITDKKTEIKRKVSFREEVDISGAGLEPESSQDQPLDFKDYHNPPDSSDCGQAFFDDIKFELEESPPVDSQEDIKQLSSRISDLLMTDSLMQIAKEIPKYETKKLKQSTKRSSPKSLNLTNSARNVLAKLSKSFEQDEDYKSASGVLDSDMAKHFYDKGGNPIAEVYNSYGDLLFKLKDNNVHKLTSVLFDPEGQFLKNRYDVDGKRIKMVYDASGKAIRHLSQNAEDFKGIQADLETVEYYDYKGKPIKHLYDSLGYEIKTVGKDLTSRIFDADGRLQNDIFTKRGGKIDAIYDSHGHLIAKVPENHLEPAIRREQVRVAKLDDDSLNKLFEGENKSVKFENEDSTKKDGSPKRFFDQEGNPLTGVYDKKGKPIKLTSSGEADELLPFLFDTKGKLQSKRFDSKGKELKAVFGEDGKAISEMSIAWLNELLANSKESNSKTKKKAPFFKRISKSKTKTDKQCDIDKFYDSNGKIITSIFDAKGKPLAVTLSGDANKLIPVLFDRGGKFIKKRYDSEKRKVRCVYGRDGNIITTISITYIDSVVEKLKNEDNQDQNKNKSLPENNRTSQIVSGETEGDMTITKSAKSFDCFENVPDQIYDEDGNVLTAIYDNEGNILENTSSGNAWKLLPYLFDHQGNFMKKRFDKKGRELIAIYDKEGENLNNDLSAAIKITVGKRFAPTENSQHPSEKRDDDHVNERSYESSDAIDRVSKHEIKYNENEKCKTDNIEISKEKESLPDIRKKVSSNASVTNPSKHDMVRRTTSATKQTEVTLQKEKHDKKQLKPTTSITKNQSFNQKFDIPDVQSKAGESIENFYDEKGNPITEVYDIKGRTLIRTKLGEVEQLARVLFDKKGFLLEHIYDRKGRRIKQLFDHKRRSISRISLSSILSGDKISKQHQNDKKIPGSIYNKKGYLLKEVYDKKGHPIILTRIAKLEDLAPIIFDENGVRRRVFDKSGYEIGPVYDYKGNELKHLPVFKKPKPKPNYKDARIFSKSGRPLRNFYDSEGTLIIALYNDYGKTLCSVKKGFNNVELLSKFFFDKEGHFYRGRFYNFRGQMIRHVYDSDNNVIRSIKRTESRRIAHHKSSNREGGRSQRKNTDNANKLNLRIKNDGSKHRQRGYHGRSEVRPVENIMGNFSSQSDTKLNPVAPLVQRSMSAYSLGDYPKRYALAKNSSSSNSSLLNISIKKFYDENGKLLTGVYNSKTRLLGYTASGNARVLAPYLFDTDGNFISGRYNLNRKPLTNIFDSNGKLVEKLSNTVVNKTKKEIPKTSKGFKFHDLNGDTITSVYDVRGDKILDITSTNDKIVNLFDKNGKLKKNLYNNEGSKLKVYEENPKGAEKTQENQSSEEVRSEPESDVCEEREKDHFSASKGRFSALNNFKDKILTVIFDNQQRLSQKLSRQTSKKRRRNRPEEKNSKKIPDDTNNKKKQKRTHLYDKNLMRINDIYDDRGRIIKKLHNSDGQVIEDLYSVSGTLMKNKVLRNMFDKNVFKPKVFNSEGNIIPIIYANKRVLKKVYDENGEPAKVDSDLIYLVSQQSLPDDEPIPSKPAPKQVNYFSEGSTYPFPEGQHENSQIKYQHLTEEQNYETEMEVAFNGYSRRTDNCICENCQKMGNRKNIVQFGGEMLNRLSRFTIPFRKLLPRTFSRRDYDSDEIEGEVDSLETLIDQAANQNICVEGEDSDKDYYGSNTKVLQESDENVPISRKMIEETLRNCVHLNSSSNLVGKVSDTVLQHFANLIMHEIEQKFYRKLNVLQCGGNNSEDSSHIFQCDGEKDICIGTELKFEDSLIGKHSSAQTHGKCRICGSSLESFNQALYGYFESNSINTSCVNHKAFVCKVPNVQPFIMTMKSNIRSSEEPAED